MRERSCANAPTQGVTDFIVIREVGTLGGEQRARTQACPRPVRAAAGRTPRATAQESEASGHRARRALRARPGRGRDDRARERRRDPDGGEEPAAKVSATASPSATATATASPAAVTEPATHCSYTSASAGSVVKSSLPTASPDYKAAYTASINTNLGPIKINLANSKATCTVNSFVHLASDNFWNDSQCHRLSTTGGLYMLQCGDPTAKASQTLSCSSTTLGTGGPGYEYASETCRRPARPAASRTRPERWRWPTVAGPRTGASSSSCSRTRRWDRTTRRSGLLPLAWISSRM